MSETKGLTDALAQILDHEGDLPADPTALLKRIGWVFAHRMYESGSSRGSFLRNDLRVVCTGERNALAWDDASYSMVRQEPDVQGWFIDQLYHLNSTSSMNGKMVRFKFVYLSPVTGKRHAIRLTNCTDGYEVAVLFLKGRGYYWFHDDNRTTIVMGEDPDLPSSRQCKIMEAVNVCAADVIYTRYDIGDRSCIIHETFTTNFSSGLYIKKFSAVHGAPFAVEWQWVDALLDILTGEAAPSTAMLNRVANDLERITEPVSLDAHGSVTMPLSRLAQRLTNQMRSRLYRVAKTLVVNRAQEREERIASDPVKKCAACAIQAAKSQLVLGLDHKRQRV